MNWNLASRLKKIFRSDFLKKSFVLISGTALAQFISILTAPVLTRIYSPADYGLLGVYMMVTGLITLFTTLQYHNAIIIEKDHDEAKKVLELCLTLTTIVSALSFLVILVIRRPLSQSLNVEGISNWLFLAPVSVFFSGLNVALLAWANRFEQFKLMSFNRILSAVLVPVVSISIGLASNSFIGLILGFLLSQVIPAVLLSRHFLKNQSIRLVFNKGEMIKTFKKHKYFPRFSMPTEFINNFIAQIPIFFLGTYFGTGVIGQYNLSNRILGIPSQLLSASFGEVFKLRASQEFHERGRCDSVFLKTFRLLFFVSLIPFGLIVILGPRIFPLVFGNEWLDAGKYAQIMAPMYFLRFSISPLTFVLFLRSKQVIDFLGTITYAVSTIVVSLIILNYTTNVYYFLLGYVLNFIWIYLIMFGLSYKYSK